MLLTYKKRIRWIVSFCFILTVSHASTDIVALKLLKKAYPDFIKSVSATTIVWQDGTVMPVNNNNKNKTVDKKLVAPALIDQVIDVLYTPGIPADTQHFNPVNDPGRIRYMPFFQKMYGQTAKMVQSKLVTIYWMPAYFADKYPLKVTTVNHIDKKLVQISRELEVLVSTHPNYLPYLKDPGGTFMWRVIANTSRLSPHSFGMTIDINATLSNYWQWDLEKEGNPIKENQVLTYHNSIPWAIIPIFEKQGFIWGGKWHHYDSMHFEYRPELLVR